MAEALESDLKPREPRVSSAGFRIGRVFGVEIRADWSLLIIFALVTVELALYAFPSWHPAWHPAITWLTAIGAALAFFASILAHELSHAVVANRMGLPVRAITLFLFGGLAHLEAEPESPKTEFWMAIVGPITSVVIGVGASALGLWLGGDGLRAAIESGSLEAIQVALGEIGPGTTLLLWLGPINVLLGLFNVIPGFPLDGGRVLRSILWASTGSLRKATRWASRIGQGFAWTLMALGVIRMFAGVFVGGLWLVLIGWFLNNAARASYQHLLIREALADIPVSRVMRSALRRVDPELTVERFVRDYALASEQDAFPVEVGDQLIGLVSLDQVRELERSLWPTTTVQQIMIPASELITLPPEAQAERALTELARKDTEQLLVFDGERLLGLVRRRDLVRWLSFREWGEAQA